MNRIKRNNMYGSKCPTCGNLSVFTTGNVTECVMGIGYCRYKIILTDHEIRLKKLTEILKK